MITNMKKKPIELYIHIPFCVKKCDYCDFLSFRALSSVHEAYVQQLIREIIQSAKDSLLELDDGAYFRLIFQMAAKFALPQQGKLILNEKDLGRAPKDFNAQLEAAVKAIPGAALSLSDSTRPIDGGFVLDYDGIEENCSFDALFYSSQEDLQDKVQELLFQ